MEQSSFGLLHGAAVHFSTRFTGLKIKMKIQIRCSTVASWCVVVALGCTSGTAPPPKTYPVSGSVAYNGQPLAGAKVMFMAETSTAPATGVTDKDGKFQLSTYAINDGAVAGEHKITVIKEDAAAAQTTDFSPSQDPSKMAQMYNKKKDEGNLSSVKMTLPAKYASVTSTPLKETVKEGPNQFVLQLVD